MSNVSVYNMSIVELDQYRGRLSDETATVLVPAIILFGVILIAGAVGNSLVLYVYYFKFKTSYIRTAILALALFDLITCLLCIPGEILDMRFSYNYVSPSLCKGQRLVTTAVQMASGFALVCVAKDRYHRICHPLRQQATARDAMKRILACCFLAVALAIPAALVYGIARVPTPIEGLKGLECSTSETFKRHPLRLVYNAVLCLVFVAAFVPIIIYYVLIGKRVMHQGQLLRQRRDSCISVVGCRQIRPRDSTGDNGCKPSIFASNVIVKDESSIDDITKSPPTSPSKPTKLSAGMPEFASRTRRFSMTRKGLDSQAVDASRHVSVADSSARIRKTTAMLFLISLIFVLSFLPHLALKVTQALRSSLLENLSPAATVSYNVIVRSHFFNAATNWIVYGLCSPKFRRECKVICQGVTLWTSNKNLSRASEDGI
ncbi:hypothetical protein EGW08_013452 [Elysia chlorotica]|uniref:G-protein coupled receptors family 1 profile domain-containing protein n=1 Tax=Elysia chlorotica TaxID=188477 RepID=A0A3S0ZZ64_ELYCH|nr:hypothetical protein EGW08_013452 [Elysia chlorotica]